MEIDAFTSVLGYQWSGYGLLPLKSTSIVGIKLAKIYRCHCAIYLGARRTHADHIYVCLLLAYQKHTPECALVSSNGNPRQTFICMQLMMLSLAL